MSTERDELATTILHHPWLPDHEELYTGLCPECPGRKISGGHNSPSHADHLADALLTAGYRKPRTITTAEELDALPVESVVRAALGSVYVKDYNLDLPSEIWWSAAGSEGEFQSSRISLPATVLHEPAVTS